MLLFTITDNGSGIRPELLAKLNDIESEEGHGIKNVMKRINLYYGEKASVKLSSKVGEGTTVNIWMPLERIDANV